MKFLSGKALEEKKKALEQQYPTGTRVELNFLCNDECDMPSGLRGTVVGVDDQPALLMRWDSERTLSLFPGEDSFRRLTPEEITAEQSQESEMKMQ